MDGKATAPNKPTQPIEPTEPTAPEWKNPFADVDGNAYYASAVVRAQQNGIVNGIYELRQTDKQYAKRKTLDAKASFENSSRALLIIWFINDFTTLLMYLINFMKLVKLLKIQNNY